MDNVLRTRQLQRAWLLVARLLAIYKISPALCGRNHPYIRSVVDLESVEYFQQSS